MKENTGVKTIHHAVVDFNSKLYIFHHNGNLADGGECYRSAAVEEFQYGEDGQIGLIAQSAQEPAANPSSD